MSGMGILCIGTLSMGIARICIGIRGIGKHSISIPTHCMPIST